MSLAMGSSGSTVGWVQQRLNALAGQLVDESLHTTEIDGRFGPSTLAAVIAFQRMTNIVVDGIVGPATLAELQEHASEAPPVERRALAASDREKLLTIVARFEGSYWTLNLDGEFEGLFDRPKRDSAGRKIPPQRRKDQPGFKPLGWSKYGRDPGHVGLSFGFVQFTQDGGNLGALLRAMREADHPLFDEIFGEHSGELVRVTCLEGPRVRVADEASPTGLARRSPRVAPIAGAELWRSPWKERLVRAGHEPAFQSVQRRMADVLYVRSMISKCAIPFDVKSEKGLCILLDRSIQMGPGGCARLLKKHWAGKDAWTEPRRFAHLYDHVRKEFWSHRMRKILDDIETSFQLELTDLAGG